MSKTGNQLNTNLRLIKQPRITEKATALADQSAPVYTFVVAPASTKTEIMAAVKAKYNVKPLKVNIVKLPAKVKVRRGIKGKQSAVKKALVYLKAGDKIDLV